jgi:phosphoglycolate phosphatase-like HAD superfamily hydrolase
VQHLMFDIDGTLLQFDTDLFSLAVFEETGIEVDTSGSKYSHVSDAGLLRAILATAKYERQHAQVAAAVKENFYNKIAQHLQASPVMEIAGAREFLLMLMKRDDLHLFIATGCWFETARLKLQSAKHLFWRW